MRAAFVTAEVVAAGPDGQVALQRLAEAGLRPVVLVPHQAEDGEAPATPYPQVSCPPPDDSRCWGEHPELLMRAAMSADVGLSEAFLVSHRADDLGRALEMGCRPVLVLGDRRLDDLLGPHEPETKGFAVATDLPTAVGYMLDEAAQERELGPFPFGPHRAVDDRPIALLPTSGDLTRIFIIVSLAGVAAGLGAAYLLKEIYKTFTFPAIAYWLTLQFIPQTWRGLLFLSIGAAGALLAQRILNSIVRRRQPS
jgi:hypothetical protein